MITLDQRLSQLQTRQRPQTVGQGGLGPLALARTAEEPGRVVVIDGDRHVTREQLLHAALSLGGALSARGVHPGAAIAFQLPNWWEACVINLTAALFGYRLVPLLTIYRSNELEQILPACGVEVLFIFERFRKLDGAALMAGLRNPPRHVVFVRGEDGAGFEEMLAHGPGTPAPATPEDAKMVLFTSGSTGRAKGVIHSHAAFDALITRTADFWQTGPDDVFFVPSPIGHIGGSIYAFEFPWMTGCTAVLADHWDAASAVRRMETLGITFMAGATPFLRGLIAEAKQAGTSLPGLRRFICGGASVSPELVRQGLAQFPNAVVSRAYGSTEVPLACPGIRNRDEAHARADTDGEVLAELAVLAPDGGPVADGESGEIVLRAPQMFLGYLDPADDQGCFTPDGSFRMGDLGRLVDEQFIEITGRQKDIIIRKGENISPLEIENALMRHPSVRMASVVGVPDEARGEMVVAFVVPHDGAAFDFAAMQAHLGMLDMARQKYPERLEVVQSLPMNAVGKVKKIALRARAQGQGASVPQQAGD